MKISDIKDVNRKVEQGAWVTDLARLPGVAVKVRALWNADFFRLSTELNAGLSEDEQNDPAIQAAHEIRLLSETVLVDWSGIEDADYSPEQAVEFLSDPEMEVFLRAVRYAANVVLERGRASLEDDAKNS